MSTIINASTSSGLVQTADTSGTLELQSNGTTQLTVSATGAYGQLRQGTAQASTSGTSIDFTSIPSWAKRITVMFSGVSTNGTSNLLVQIGAGSVTSSGYVGSVGTVSGTNATFSAGFNVNDNVSAANNYSGVINICLISGNTWCESSNVFPNTSAQAGCVGGGYVSLSGTLNRVRITTVNGTDTFDAGSINILYEG